jgi:hypothetical protein
MCPRRRQAIDTSGRSSVSKWAIFRRPPFGAWIQVIHECVLDPTDPPCPGPI